MIKSTLLREIMKAPKEKKRVVFNKELKTGLKKISLLFFGLGFVLYQTISYAKSDNSSSEIETFELQIPDAPEISVSETPIQEIQKPESAPPSSSGGPLLSVKGELLMAPGSRK